MDPTTRRRVRELFMQVADLPDDQRDQALADGSAGDPAVRAEVERLLKLEREAGGFMSSPTASTAPLLRPISERPGSRIGPYKLLETIGEGGFGSVFLADQTAPVRRRVALKIIKLGMDTRGVVARFEAERQALALMDHPNIAKVFDAGSTDSGRPYFVMEYVKGDPITLFADAHTLTLRERLELLTQVCLAVQHAHQKGVIHRDIKPSNVLVSMVDGKPLAKVIDFGIAKATGAAGGTLTDKTLFTEHRALIGTPEYMSPEQAEGSPDIDTRTDVYGLGVLMYELLTGTTPFEPSRLRSAAYAEMQRIIKEEDPPSPSLRVSRDVQRNLKQLASTAAQRKVEPQKLNTLMRGELDWIVMKALDKDRARRFATPQDLAADIERHLRGEAVVAAPASAGYRLRKFVRRNKGAVGAVSAVLVALLIGIAGTTWQAWRAESARRATATQAEVQRLTVARMNVQQQRFDRARSALSEPVEFKESEQVRWWAAWELARASRLTRTVNLAINLPSAIAVSAVRTAGGSAQIDVKNQLVRFSQGMNRFCVQLHDGRVVPDQMTADPSHRNLADGTTITEVRLGDMSRVNGLALDRHGLVRSTHTVDGGISAWDVNEDKTKLLLYSESGILEEFSVSQEDLRLKSVRRLSVDPEVVLDMRYSADGKRACIVTDNWVYREYELSAWADANKIQISPRDLRRLAFSENGERLAVMGYDGQIDVLSYPDLRRLKSFATKGARIGGGTSGSVSFVGNDRIYYSTVRDGVYTMLLSADDRIEPVKVPMNNEIVALAASGGLGGVVGSYERPGGRGAVQWLGFESSAAIDLCEGDGVAYALGADAKSQTVFVARSSLRPPVSGADRPELCQLEVWSIRDRRLLRVLHSHILGLRAVALSVDSKVLAVASRDGTVSLWDWSNGKLLHKLVVRRGYSHTNIITGVAISPREPVVATLTNAGEISLWSATTGVELASLPIDSDRTIDYGSDQVGRAKEIRFSPSGNELLITVKGQLWVLNLRAMDARVSEILQRQQ